MTKLKLIDSVARADNVFLAGVGPDGKIATFHHANNPDFVLEAGGKSYPIPEGSFFDGLENLTCRADDGTGGAWLGHLDPATSTIVIDKHWDDCTTNGIDPHGFSDNVHFGTTGIARLSLVSPQGDETDVSIPDPSIEVANFSDTYIVGTVGGTSEVPRARRRPTIHDAGLMARHSSGPTSAVRLPDSNWLLAPSSQVKLQQPPGVTGGIQVLAVNNEGESVGFVRTPGGDRAVEWDFKGAAKILPPLPALGHNWQATGISDDGIVTGWYGEAGAPAAPKQGVIWQHGVPKLASSFVANASHLQAFTGITDTWKVGAESSSRVVYLFQGS